MWLGVFPRTHTAGGSRTRTGASPVPTILVVPHMLIHELVEVGGASPVPTYI
jgi:hypothetical protein